MLLRGAAAITALCAIVAFILSLLCLLSGRKPGFIEDAYLVTLNTSRLGYFEKITIPNPSSSGSGFLNSLEGSIVNGINDILNGLQNGVSEAGNDIAKVIGIHDWYSMHMLNYCEGYFVPNGTTIAAKKNITECSSPKTSFWFDPGSILQSELKGGLTLDNIHWPTQIDDQLEKLRVVTHALLGILFTGVALEGLLFLTSLVGLIGSRAMAGVNAILAVLAFLFVGVSSGVATGIIVKAVKEINEFTDELGITAVRGTKFLAMTWAAVALLLIAVLVETTGCCAGRRDNEARKERRARRHRI